MATSSLPLLENTDSLKLKVENKTRNIFVTQSAQTRLRKERNVNHIPVVTETSSRILEAGVNTLQKTLVLKKQAELDEVDKQLALKRQEFKGQVEALAQKRSELELKHQQTKDRAMKFEKFVAENELKRRRALKKFEVTREQNILKQAEIEELSNGLRRLQTRGQVLKERIAKYKIYEDYLMRTLSHLPSSKLKAVIARDHVYKPVPVHTSCQMEHIARFCPGYLDNGSESLVMPIIRRHETLSIINQELLRRLERLELETEQGQQRLQTMQQEHSVKSLLANKELSELQSELEVLKEKNKQEEANLLMEQGLSREKVEEVGRLLMAISNLAEQCYLPAYGPLQNMNLLTMLDMVKEYILDKADTERRARKLMRSASAATNKAAAVTDKRWRGSKKSIDSKTHLKSSSKVSKKSDSVN
ncbi:coiled-coil domain-containing protein 42 homolog isoform X1 [Betta splendens]|uniref:Coiled-coil domain-containing protein 42 homolog isoform X1 n=1 Tax=Betta splendens TaxID=158456 RepID=A0A6P7LID5_BETSP|nr:coiled-coil domain-containing protein 42 homolog isoform X1 [Betta splendens]